MKTHSKVKGERRAAKWHKKRYGQRVTGRSVFVLQRPAEKRAEKIEQAQKNKKPI